MPIAEVTTTQTEESEPFLQGELAHQARAAVDDIIRDLLALPPERLYCQFQEELRPSLALLEPWVSLLLGYAANEASEDGGEGLNDEALNAEALNAEALTAEALEMQTLALLDEAQQSMAVLPGLNLFGGWCGIGWALSHLTEAEDDDLTELDVLVERYIRSRGGDAKLDLIGGLVGSGVYLLERLPRESAASGLRSIVDALEERAEVVGEGRIAWLKRPELMHEAERVDGGVYNLGVAHGIPGIVGLLAHIHRAGIARQQCRDLLAKSLPWILEQRLPVVGQSCLPRRIAAGEQPTPSRIAWCYGELGATVPMLAAARELEDADLERRVLDLALHAARVRGPAAGVLDPGLCHGAVGNAHIFHRLYRSTGEPALREAALYWFEQTFEYRRPGIGIGGFQSCYPGRAERPWRDDASVVMGSTGIGLALLAAISDEEPAWDRLFLLS